VLLAFAGVMIMADQPMPPLPTKNENTASSEAFSELSGEGRGEILWERQARICHTTGLFSTQIQE